jgi:KaiC/GvpD/RAD55 family RecA-like ATPase
VLKKKDSDSTKKNKTSEESNRNSISSLKSMYNYVALAVIEPERYHKQNIKLFKQLVGKGVPGVYVTLTKPYKTIKAEFLKEKFDLDKTIFIDAVSKYIPGKVKKEDDCLYIGSPKDLTDISIAMDQAVMAIPEGNKYLFFDSLSVLTMYNKLDVVAKFIHFISTRMRAWKVKGIIISLRKNKDKELINELKEFCDVTLNL